MLKLEALQPSGSFKLRGVGELCTEAARSGVRRFISSSGGNAGLAVAYAGQVLGLPVTVFVPRTTPESVRARIREYGASVEEAGAAWDDAHAHAQSLARDPETEYVHPFDDPRLWAGHATLIEECAQQMGRPAAVVVAVGGGGLLCGVLEGMQRVDWGDVPVVASETYGADSFYRSLEAGRLVTLDGIESIAKSLGARTVAQAALDWAERRPLRAVRVRDDEALAACVAFANDERLLVEPACGAALAVAQQHDLELGAADGDVLAIACGGVGVDLATLGART